jgi:hypothetical protein
MVPGTDKDASVIELTLTPQVQSQTVYLQQPLIIASYSRANVLVKLDIFYPFTAVTADETTKLLTFNQVRGLQPTQFFPLYIAPANLQEAWAGPSGLSSIAPQELALAYFLDTEKGLLQPIFTFKGTSAQQSYLYATLAFPTKSAP